MALFVWLQLTIISFINHLMLTVRKYSFLHHYHENLDDVINPKSMRRKIFSLKTSLILKKITQISLSAVKTDVC